MTRVVRYELSHEYMMEDLGMSSLVDLPMPNHHIARLFQPLLWVPHTPNVSQEVFRVRMGPKK